MRRALALVTAWIAGGLAVPVAAAELRVVATTPNLADLAREVGGERVEASSLMRGPENVHNVTPKPSFALRLRKADLFVHSGLDAEPWVPNLVRSARQARLLPGGEANVDASVGVMLLEVPDPGGLSRAFGDIHVYGNPHYLLDPQNGAIVGRTLAAAFAGRDPEGAASYAENAAALETRLRALTERLRRRLDPWPAAPVIVYHRTWSYFLARFGLREVGTVEPRPGIAPGPGHVRELAAKMRREDVRVIVLETYSDVHVAERLAGEAGARAVVLAQEVGALPDATSYPTLFERNVEKLADAFAASGDGP